MHSRTTAPEILEAFEGERLDYFVTGFGTGGTLKGVARVLRKRSPQTKVIVCEPDNSQMLGSGIPQPRAPDGSPAGSHPNFRPHLMQGWSPDFIPKLTEDAVAQKLIDRIVPVNGAEAMRLSRELARKEGIFVGISARRHARGRAAGVRGAPAGSHGAVHAAGHRRAVSEHATVRRHSGGHDRGGDRDFALDAELSVRCAAAGAAAAAGEPPPSRSPVSADAAAFVEQGRRRSRAAGDDVRARVVRVLLVRAAHVRASTAFRIGRSISIRSSISRTTGAGRFARRSRRAPRSPRFRRSSSAGEFLGGCTDVFDAYKQGRFQELLEKNNVTYDRDLKVDPYSFLPTWLHPR